jgi:hypothetical protein
LPIPDNTNRRRSPRHQARHEIWLTASASLLDTQTQPVDDHQEQPLTLFGSTHDLSEAGVSLVVPFLSIDKRYCCEEEQMLPVVLYLPGGEVHMRVAPVHCQLLDEKEPGKGFFMGARIREIETEERACLIEYLRAAR